MTPAQTPRFFLGLLLVLALALPAHGQTCGTAPTCIAPTPTGTITVFVGQTTNFTVRAQSNNTFVGTAVEVQSVAAEFAPFVGGSCGMQSPAALPAGYNVSNLNVLGDPTVDSDTTWTPTTADIGCWTFTYTIFESDCGEFNTCPINIEVTECVMLIGMNPIQAPLFGDPNDLLRVNPLFVKPILLNSIPDVQIPDIASLYGFTFYAQTVMINSDFDPADPVKVSPRLDVTIGVGSNIVGNSSGMGIWSQNPVVNPGGTFQLQFSIAGF